MVMFQMVLFDLGSGRFNTFFSSQVFAYDYCFWSIDETQSDKFAGLLILDVRPKHTHACTHTLGIRTNIIEKKVYKMKGSFCL